MTRRSFSLLGGLVALALASATPAAAHSQSYGYLQVEAGGANTGGRLELAVRDLDLVHGLDGNGDGSITWGEIRLRESEIASAMLAGVAVSRGGACQMAPSPVMVDSHGGETYLVVPFALTCPQSRGDVSVGYDLMFDRDAQHRGLVAVAFDGGSQSAVMSPENRSAVMAERSAGALSNFVEFTRHGAHHIWIGYDHILFLITLLLATVLQTRGLGLRPGLVQATKVVTAFTAAHSLTLALAATGLVSIPAQITESLIALTIALAAANNIWPVISARVWVMALAFGLVHGLGFANVLGELGLSDANLLVSLTAFNVGVEIGQLAIVAVALPALQAIAAPRIGYRAMPVSNAVIVAIGLAWFSDRALGTGLMPF